MIFSQFAAAPVALALALVASTPLLAQAPEYQHPETVIHTTPAPDADPWPFAHSDLELDPAYRVGTLDNGMRYIIRPNGTPAGQGMVYLWVNTGSMNEDDDQLGYAHFLEHMAFNGSANVPEGEMIRLLEREGLAFGPDTNASTGFDRTIYQLNLPRNDTGLLETALMLMRETASELSIAPEAVQREIGVIQAERRVRDTYAQDNTIDNLAFLYPGSRFADRWVSGTTRTIAAATAQRLRDYYQRWYRPDNAAIIVIGDYNADAVEALVRQQFAGWQAEPTRGGATGGPVDYAHADATDIFVHPALSESVTVTRTSAWIDRPDTAATRAARVQRQIGYAILNRRLQSLSRSQNAPFRAAGIGTDEIFKVARSTNLVVQTGEGEWAEGLAAAQEEYRRALQFGFSEAEVAEQVANLRSAIELNAAGADTRDNRAFMTGALALLEDGQVPTTPASGLERFERYAPAITPESVLAAVRADIVALDDPLIRFTGRAIPEGGEAALRAAWDEGMAIAPAPHEELELADFAYTDFGTPGTVVSDTTEPLLGIRTIRFDNNVRLNLKRTALEDDDIGVRVYVDGGEMLDTPDNPLATSMFGSLATGGLGKHTLDELQSVLAGRRAGMRLNAEEDVFAFGGSTTPRDLAIQLQLIAAAISDPGYRATGEPQYRRSVASFFARLGATPASALSAHESAIVSDDDPRYSLASEDAFMQLTFAGLRADIADRLAHGAIEVAMVGDFDEQEAIDLVAATLGALPERERDFRPYTENRVRSFTQDRSRRVLTHTGSGNQALLKMAWPTRDGEDLTDHLTLELLQRVMRLELTDTLREELGQTYSPSVGADQSRVWPDWGTFSIAAAVDVAQLEATREAMLATLDDLRAAPVDEDTMLRARQPALEALDNALKTNAGWMRLVDRAQSQPDRIERYARSRAMLLAITAQDVRAMALRYLDPAERLEIVVVPETASSAR